MLEVISIILTAINNNQFFIREGMDFQLEDVPTGTHLLSCEEYTAKQGKVLISGFFHVNSVESLTIFLELSRTYLLFSTLLPLQNQKHYCRPLPHAVAYRLIPQNNVVYNLIRLQSPTPPGAYSSRLTLPKFTYIPKETLPHKTGTLSSAGSSIKQVFTKISSLFAK